MPTHSRAFLAGETENLVYFSVTVGLANDITYSGALILSYCMCLLAHLTGRGVTTGYERTHGLDYATKSRMPM